MDPDPTKQSSERDQLWASLGALRPRLIVWRWEISILPNDSGKSSRCWPVSSRRKWAFEPTPQPRNDLARDRCEEDNETLPLAA